MVYSYYNHKVTHNFKNKKEKKPKLFLSILPRILFLLPHHHIYLSLQDIKEFGCMSTVHLGVVELERYGQGGLEPRSLVLTPNHKRIVEYAAIHTHSTVNFILRQSRGADHHTLGREVMVGAALRHLLCKAQVVAIELRQILTIRQIARTHLARCVGNNGVYSHSVVLHQLIAHGQHIKLLDLHGGTTNAVAHQHIEFQPSLAANSHEARDIKRFEKCNHRHRSLHPHLKGISTSCLLGIYLSHGCNFLIKGRKGNIFFANSAKGGVVCI